jgi:hypothetical protein
MRSQALPTAALACAGCVADLKAPPTVDMDTSTVLHEVADYRDHSSFDVVSKTYVSALGASILIDVYVSREAAAAYDAIAPESTGSGVHVPVGGVIVREVLDANGVAQKLTVLAKGPPGYNPMIGDWYWAVTDLAGVPVTMDGGVREGKLIDCYGCHIPRSTDDFLFGVPRSDRADSGMSPPPPPPPQGSGAPVCGDFDCDEDETMSTCPKDCNHGHTH